MIWTFANGVKRANSIEPTTQDVLTTVSTFDISPAGPISPAEYPVHFSPLKGTLAEIRMSVPDDSLKRVPRLESSQPPDDIKTYLPAVERETNQSTSDIMFSSFACAICLNIIEDGVQVRGLPCGHAFHVDCVDKWLLWHRPCCPLCKASYQKPPEAV